jgi:hypothetical protein
MTHRLLACMMALAIAMCGWAGTPALAATLDEIAGDAVQSVPSDVTTAQDEIATSQTPAAEGGTPFEKGGLGPQ